MKFCFSPKFYVATRGRCPLLVAYGCPFRMFTAGKSLIVDLKLSQFSFSAFADTKNLVLQIFSNDQRTSVTNSRHRHNFSSSLIISNCHLTSNPFQTRAFTIFCESVHPSVRLLVRAHALLIPPEKNSHYLKKIAIYASRLKRPWNTS